MLPDDMNLQTTRPSYAPAHFVGRQSTIHACQRWLNQDQSRLLLVTAPPGMGKTWLLKHIYHGMQIQNQPALWFDAPIKNLDLTNNSLSDNELAGWLSQIIFDTRQYFPQIRPFDPVVEPQRMVEAFAEDLVRKCWPDQVIYIFVDGCDLLDMDSWRQVERQILEPIAQQQNIRFLIALRNSHRLRLPVLRYSEKRIDLPAFEEEEQGNQQVEKLASTLSRKQREVVENLIKPYISSYPGLNSLLFLQARNNVLQGNPQLKADFWQEVLVTLNHLPVGNNNHLTQAGKCVLVKLLWISRKLERKWTHEQASEGLGVPVAEISRWIEELRQYWLIDSERVYYFIQDGLSQFLQAVISNHEDHIALFLNEEEKLCR